MQSFWSSCSTPTKYMAQQAISWQWRKNLLAGRLVSSGLLRRDKRKSRRQDIKLDTFGSYLLSASMLHIRRTENTEEIKTTHKIWIYIHMRYKPVWLLLVLLLLGTVDCRRIQPITKTYACAGYQKVNKNNNKKQRMSYVMMWKKKQLRRIEIIERAAATLRLHFL